MSETPEGKSMKDRYKILVQECPSGEWVASTKDDHHALGSTPGRALVQLGIYLDALSNIERDRTALAAFEADALKARKG